MYPNLIPRFAITLRSTWSFTKTYQARISKLRACDAPYPTDIVEITFSWGPAAKCKQDSLDRNRELTCGDKLCIYLDGAFSVAALLVIQGGHTFSASMTIAPLAPGKLSSIHFLSAMLFSGQTTTCSCVIENSRPVDIDTYIKFRTIVKHAHGFWPDIARDDDLNLLYSPNRKRDIYQSGPIDRRATVPTLSLIEQGW